jgi:hypothetical protein
VRASRAARSSSDKSTQYNFLTTGSSWLSFQQKPAVSFVAAY